jgi:hypothetical protein
MVEHIFWDKNMVTACAEIVTFVHFLQYGRRRSYLTFLKRAWSAHSKMVRYVLLRPLRPELKGDTAASFFGEWQKSYRFKLALFLWIGSENVGPSAVQWQLLHVEKDDQVIRHNNNKTWETKEKSIRKAFLFKTLVKNRSAEKYLFCFAGSVLFSLLCVYYFCTIFVIYQKNWLRYHPLDG